jgi:hypothetical protein
MTMSQFQHQRGAPRTGHPRVHRTVHNLLVALIAAFALSSTACAGIVIDPIGGDTYVGSGATRFWGYSINPGQTMLLQTQNNSGTWVTQRTFTSSTTPTHGAGRTGYAFDTSHDPRSLSSVFRRPANAGYVAVTYRVYSEGAGPAFARGGNIPVGASDLEMQFGTGVEDGVIRLLFRP